MKKIKMIIELIISKFQTILRKKNSSTIGITSNLKKFDKHGFDQNGIDADGRSIDYYKGELKDIYNRMHIWDYNVKYDIKVYACRRTMENIMMLVLSHNYGSNYIKDMEQRTLCNYINIVNEKGLLGWDSYRLEEIRKTKCYMNNIIHPYQNSYNEIKNNKMEKSIKKLITEFKKSIGIITVNQQYSIDISTKEAA